MDKHKNTHARKSSRKRCLSDLYSQNREELFEEVVPDRYPPAIKNFLQEQGQLDATVRILPNNLQSYLKVFTFQYLTLCYKNKNQQAAGNYEELIYQLIQKEQFEFILPESPHELSHQSQMSLKNIISQYLNYMSENSDSVAQSLAKYPLIMEIFVAFFKTMLYLGDICDPEDDEDKSVDKQQIFEFLTSYFQVQAIGIKQFIVFKDSKVIIFEQSKSSSKKTPLYIIYQEDTIYKIDDSKFSSMLNRKEEAVYKSGISSVKCLISNIDIKSHEQIQLTDRKDHLKLSPAEQVNHPNSEIIIEFSQSQKSVKDAKNKKPSVICEEKEDDGVFNYRKTSDTEQSLSEKNVFQDQQLKNKVPLNINRVITEQSSQMMSQSESFQNSSQRLKNCINNLVNLEAKNVSYSLGEESSSLKFYDNCKENRQKQRSIFNSELKQNIIPENYCGEMELRPNKTIQSVSKLRKWECYSPPESSNNVRSIIDKYEFEEFNPSNKNIEKFKLCFENSWVNEKLGAPEFTKKSEEFVPYRPKSQKMSAQENSLEKLKVSLNRVTKRDAKMKWNANLNLTKEFTNSIILQAVSEPHKSMIQKVKNKARADRKNARTFLM